MRSVLVAGTTLAFAGHVSAETLQQALAATYRYSPVLESQRSRLRAADEGVAIAHSNFLPQVAAHGGLAWSHSISGGQGGGNVLGPAGNITGGGASRISGYGFTLSLPLFTGGQLTSQLQIAEVTVRAGREALRDTERNVFLQAISAYLDVLTGKEIVKLQEKNLGVLNYLLKSTRERLSANELTRTDVAQVEARRAVALASIAATQATFKTANENYLQIIGHLPKDPVEPPVPEKLLPKTLAEAQSIAVQENPLLISALYNEEASRHQVEQVRGQMLPQVTLSAGWDDTYNSQDPPYTRGGIVGGYMSFPLFDGGRIHASVRQAKENHLGSIQNIEAVRAQMQQAVSGAWLQLQGARAQIEQYKAAIKSNRDALVGVKKEEGIGQRTFLEVLNAEQELLTAEINLASARRGLVLASYLLLAHVGRLDAAQLGLGTDIYDPTVHYEEVRRKWFGLSITHADGRGEFFEASPRAVERTSAAK